MVEQARRQTLAVALLNLVLFELICGTSAIFNIYKANNQDITRKALTIHEVNAFHQNGLHGEIIGKVAEFKDDCGVIILDYTAYVHGHILELAIIEMESTLYRKAETLATGTRTEVFEYMKKQALAKHIEEMRSLFARYLGTVAEMKSTRKQRFIPLPTAIGVGLGITTGTLVYEGITHIVDLFSKAPYGGFHYEENRQLANWVDHIEQQAEVLTNYTVQEVWSGKYGLAFTMMRKKIVETVRSVLEDVFANGRVSPRLLDHNGKGMLHLIAEFMGPTFNKSLLVSHESTAGSTLSASVLSMNDYMIELQVCYPTSLQDDVASLLMVAPLGEFSNDTHKYWLHDLPRYYSLPDNSQNLNVLAGARVVKSISECKKMGELRLCELEEQKNGCGLIAGQRQSCRIKEYNSSDETFTKVTQLFRSIIVATKMPTISYRVSASQVQDTLRLKDRIFVAEIPVNIELHVGKTILNSQTLTGNYGGAVNFTTPKFELAYDGDSLPHWHPNSSASKLQYDELFYSILSTVLAFMITLFLLLVSSFFFLNDYYALRRQMSIIANSYEIENLEDEEENY